MTYRVKTGRPIERKGPGDLPGIEGKVRERDKGRALAMVFDPGDHVEAVLPMHAIDIMLGCLFVRGWREDKQEMLVGLARDWHDKWWTSVLGERAFVVESALAPQKGADVDDLARIVDITTITWAMTRDIHTSDRPIPDLQTAVAADGVNLANIHLEPMAVAMRAARASVIERMKSMPKGADTPTNAYIALHTDGTAVEPWALPDRPCVWQARGTEPGQKRLFVALRDTSEPANPEPVRTLLRLMIASGPD